MKLKKRVISLLLVVMLLINSIPVGYADEGELTLRGSLADAVEDMEYGWDGKTYRFADDVLKGIADGDEVYLVADVETSDSLKAGSTVEMKLTNFRLEGKDAEDYLLPDLTDEEPIKAKIKILSKTVVVRPAQDCMYVGQDRPEDDTLTELADYSDQLVKDDRVAISGKFKIDFDGSEEIGTYDVELDGSLSVTGKDASNYEVKAAKDLTFEIRAYNPAEDAVYPDSFNGSYHGITEIKLTAPKNFRISEDGENWEDSITVKLDETNDGSYTYYLRNNDKKSEYYHAICMKTVSYSSMQTTPEITGIKLELADSAEEGSKMLFEDDAVLANRNVLVTVYVTAAQIPQDTTVHLDGFEDVVITADALQLLEQDEDGKYLCEATFTIPSVEGMSAEYTLSAYAENTAGSSQRYPAKDSRDEFIGSETKVTKPLIIDREPPKVSDLTVDNNYKWQQKIRADFKIKDSGAGVAKVEYKWDNREFVEFKAYSSDKVSYYQELPWNQSDRVPGGKHNITLRVTDKLGNVTVIDYMSGDQSDDIQGADGDKPVIDSVEFQYANNGEAVKKTGDRHFSNKTVNIVIKAHDADGDEYAFKSGIRDVKVFYNESRDAETAKWSKELEAYVLSVNADKKMTGINIVVADKQNNEASKTCGDLYVENDAPNVITNIDALTHTDSGELWIGSDKADEHLEFTIVDASTVETLKNTVSGGIATVTVTILKVETAEGAEDTVIDTITMVGADSVESRMDAAYPIAGLADGTYTINIEVKDNCENTYKNSFTFTKDIEAPTDSEIRVTNEDFVEIDGNYWFDHTQVIKFRVGTTNAERLSKVVLTINGDDTRGQIYENKDTYGYGQILHDDAGYYVLVNTENVILSEQNTYTISAEIWDLGWNYHKLDDLTVHVDKENPTIERITVQKNEETVIDQVLRFLTFGIYSNDKLTFRVYAHDGEYDSGLAFGTVQFNDDAEAQMMKWDAEKGCYWFEVASSEETIFAADLTFAVEDKYGKSAAVRPIIEAEGDESENTDRFYVMVEQSLPMLSFDLPSGDGYTREDGQKWYNENKSLTLMIQDEDSGLYHASVKVNGKSYIDATSDVNSWREVRQNEAVTYNFSTDELAAFADGLENVEDVRSGEYHVEILVTDNAGNEKSWSETYYIDKILPKIDKITFKPATVDNIEEVTEFSDELVYGFFFNDAFTATVHISDESLSSGLYHLKYRLVSYEGGVKKGEFLGEKAIVDGKVEIQAPEGFVGQLFVEALDYVGNSSGEQTTKAYVTDAVAPTIGISKNVQTNYRDAKGNPLYTSKNAFTVVITDNVAGLEKITYSKSAEQNPHGLQTVNVADKMYQPGDMLDDGWEVVSVNRNLVTQIRKTFEFTADDNDVSMQFAAMDRCHNNCAPVNSEVFTIDTIAPVIRVVFRDDNDDDMYYNQNRVADIYVTERNFDADLINVLIKNTFGAVPGYSFKSNSLTEHTATIDFGEGDYTFDLNGKDLSGRDASVTFSGGNEKLFFVDKTLPVFKDNFAEFANNSENSFNTDKTATITITEHNFDPNLTNLRITRKATGAEHSHNGMVDVTSEYVSSRSWAKNGDTYSVSFTFKDDAVYYIEIAPVDLASNHGEKRSTVIFEIDKTVPVVSTKNGMMVSEMDTQFLDIYPYNRREESVPTVSFSDENISHIEYTLTTYIPEYREKGLIVIKPVVSQGVVMGDLFTLENFDKDGVYAVELVAVDVAGNRSEVNYNTYARMVNQDVLAFIIDSDSAAGTGLYSLEYENGNPISKKPYDFQDLRIVVMAPDGTDIDIVLRDTNGNEYKTEARYSMDTSAYGINVCTYEIDEAFFADEFQDDVDKEMHLTVKNRGGRIDLAKIHIDGIAATCKLPEKLKSFHWFVGEEDRVFTITDISERLDVEGSKIYDNGKEIPFEYSEEDNTITFTLSKGWHDIGFILCDEAGNTSIVPEIINVYIGVWFYAVLIGMLAIAIASVIIVGAKKKDDEEEAD